MDQSMDTKKNKEERRGELREYLCQIVEGHYRMHLMKTESEAGRNSLMLLRILYVPEEGIEWLQTSPI